jgi:hypothetical protein
LRQSSFDLPAVRRKKVTAAFDGGLISSDGGLVFAQPSSSSSSSFAQPKQVSSFEPLQPSSVSVSPRQ